MTSDRHAANDGAGRCRTPQRATNNLPPDIRRVLARTVGADGTWCAPRCPLFRSIDKPLAIALRASEKLLKKLAANGDGLNVFEDAYVRDTVAAIISQMGVALCMLDLPARKEGGRDYRRAAVKLLKGRRRG
jgi:hypothetical protein